MFKEADIIINNKQNNSNETSKTSDDDEDLNILSTNEMTNDAIEYLAGWIAKKFRSKFPELGSTTSWVNVVIIIYYHLGSTICPMVD